MVAEGITNKYSMINMDKILDAPTAIAPTDIMYGTQISNVLKGEILQASHIYIYMYYTYYTVKNQYNVVHADTFIQTIL